MRSFIVGVHNSNKGVSYTIAHPVTIITTIFIYNSRNGLDGTFTKDTGKETRARTNFVTWGLLCVLFFSSLLGFFIFFLMVGFTTILKRPILDLLRQTGRYEFLKTLGLDDHDSLLFVFFVCVVLNTTIL